MLQPHTILNGRYELQQRLGQTGAGRQTWLAVDRDAAAERVILKLLAYNPQLRWEEVELFERESTVLQNLKHPRIPRYRDSFTVDEQVGAGLPWFVLVQDYIPGTPLDEVLQSGKRLTPSQVYYLAEDILEILITLHELSPPVLHRDIKPSNLLLGQDKQFYLVDFGSVQDRATAEGASFTVVGTSGYVAPEQLWGKAVAASDLYALGTTLIHLMTGLPPAELPQRNLRLQCRAALGAIAEPATPQFIQWLEQMVDPSLERRFRTARDARQMLQLTQAPAATSVCDQDTIHYSRLLWAGLLSLLFGGVPLSLVVLPFFFYSQFPKTAWEQDAIQAVGAMNRAQQAHWLEKQQFAPSLSSLGLGLTDQARGNYRYAIQTRRHTTVQYAVAQTQGLRSLVGAVFVVPATPGSDQSTVTIRCITTAPSQARPPAPLLRDGVPLCANGTTPR